MASDWYYEKHGSRHGPVTAAELRAMCADGRLGPGDLVWKETLPRWVKAAQLSGVRFGADDPFLATGDAAAGSVARSTGGGEGGGSGGGVGGGGGGGTAGAAPAPRAAADAGGPTPERIRAAWDEARKGGRALFRNPLDDRNRVVAPVPTVLGCLLLGPVYFWLVGNRRHALRSLWLLPVTLGTSQLVYPFFAPRILRAQYFERGWKRLA